jgi:DNA-binding NarL/FixJ family response regulator
VEFHPLAAKYLKAMLRAMGSFRLLAYNEILQDFEGQGTAPSVAVIDCGVLQGSPDAYVASLRARVENGKILLIGPAIGDAELCRLILLGIRGYVRYEHVGQYLKRAIDAVWRGRLWIPTHVLEQFADYVASLTQRKQGRNTFTPREKLIVDALGKKLSNKEIADELRISLRTVKFHLENVFSKLGVHDRHSVAKLASSQHMAELFEASRTLKK